MSRWTRMTMNLSPLADTSGEGKDMRMLHADRTVQVVNAVQPGVSLQLQGSVDGTNWADIGSAYVSPAGGFLAIPNALRSLRVKTNAWSDPVAVADQLNVELLGLVTSTTTGPTERLHNRGVSEHVIVGDALLVQLNGADHSVSSSGPAISEGAAADHVRLSDLLVVQKNADAPQNIASSAPAQFDVAEFDFVKVSDLLGVQMLRDLVQSPAVHLFAIDMQDDLQLGADGLAMIMSQDLITASSSSAAPATSLPAVYVAGFDEQAV